MNNEAQNRASHRFVADNLRGGWHGHPVRSSNFSFNHREHLRARVVCRDAGLAVTSGLTWWSISPIWSTNGRGRHSFRLCSTSHGDPARATPVRCERSNIVVSTGETRAKWALRIGGAPIHTFRVQCRGCCRRGLQDICRHGQKYTLGSPPQSVLC